MRTEPEKLVRPMVSSCGECHQAEMETWEQTSHAQGFYELHRNPRATAIATAMGFPLVKENSLCLRCHYTPVPISDGQTHELRAGQGVSCESCHGAASDWIDVHNDYGTAEPDLQKARLLETPEHRTRRIAESTANGMLRPSDLYAVAASCYECHIVAVEELVNRTDHRTGTLYFELVTWSQSRMRHNFLEAFLSGGASENADRPPERLRLMYVIGRLLDLEFSIRALSIATVNGQYFRSLKARIENDIQHIERIAEAEDIREVDEILLAVSGLQIRLRNTGTLLQAADRIAAAAKQFALAHDGTSLSSLDAMIDESYEYLPLFSRPGRR